MSTSHLDNGGLVPSLSGTSDDTQDHREELRDVGATVDRNVLNSQTENAYLEATADCNTLKNEAENASSRHASSSAYDDAMNLQLLVEKYAADPTQQYKDEEVEWKPYDYEYDDFPLDQRVKRLTAELDVEEMLRYYKKPTASLSGSSPVEGSPAYSGGSNASVVVQDSFPTSGYMVIDNDFGSWGPRSDNPTGYGCNLSGMSESEWPQTLHSQHDFQHMPMHPSDQHVLNESHGFGHNDDVPRPSLPVFDPFASIEEQDRYWEGLEKLSNSLQMKIDEDANNRKFEFFPFAMSTSGSSQGSSYDECTFSSDYNVLDNCSEHSQSAQGQVAKSHHPLGQRRILPSEPLPANGQFPALPSKYFEDSQYQPRSSHSERGAGSTASDHGMSYTPHADSDYESSSSDSCMTEARTTNSRSTRRSRDGAKQPDVSDVRKHDRSEKDNFLVKSKLAGMSYREIRTKGNFIEAESTLRGRFRTLTKDKAARVRKPEWNNKDNGLLREAVQTFSRGCNSSKEKVPWKQVAEYITRNGGSYHFGNATCRKQWDELRAKS